MIKIENSTLKIIKTEIFPIIEILLLLINIAVETMLAHKTKPKIRLTILDFISWCVFSIFFISLVTVNLFSSNFCKSDYTT